MRLTPGPCVVKLFTAVIYQCKDATAFSETTFSITTLNVTIKMRYSA